MWNLEQACKVQVLAQSTGQAIRQAPASAIEKTAALYDNESVALEWGLASAYYRPGGPVLQEIAMTPECVSTPTGVTE